MVDKLKAREIHAAHYRDRVVHHWLVPRLEELYEPIFIHDVYSNRQGKGTHMAVKRLQHFMRGVSLGREDTVFLSSTAEPELTLDAMYPCYFPMWHMGTKLPRHSGAGRNDDYDFLRTSSCARTGDKYSGGFFLQLDIKNFSNSADRRILFNFLQKRLRKAVRQGKLNEDVVVSYRNIRHKMGDQTSPKNAWMPDGKMPHFVVSALAETEGSRKNLQSGDDGYHSGSHMLHGNPSLPIGARPCGRSGVVLRSSVTKFVVRQQEYLRGGLRRRCIESITISPFSQPGVLLCVPVSA